MKILYLLRHGKAEDGPVDFERGLSPRGEVDARRMGRALKKRGIKPGIVFCSDAIRAQWTAEILLPFIDIETNKVCYDHELYMASPIELVNFVAAIDNGYESALICGHNPGLEFLANFYLTNHLKKFPTCAFLEIRFNTKSWAAVGQDTAGETKLITPANL